MAIRTPQFKAGMGPLAAARLVMLRFPCNRIDRQRQETLNGKRENAHD
jgi:hypothetical protein